MPRLQPDGVDNYPIGTKSVHVEIVPAANSKSTVATAYVQPLNKTVVVKKPGVSHDHVNVNAKVPGTVTNRGPGAIDVTYR